MKLLAMFGTLDRRQSWCPLNDAELSLQGQFNTLLFKRSQNSIAITPSTTSLKVNYFSSLIYSIREKFSTRRRLMFFKAMAIRFITYGLIVYGGTLTTTVEMIEKAQQRILCAVSLKNDAFLYRKYR